MNDMILVVYGSPRLNGNSTFLSKKIIEGVKEVDNKTVIEEVFLQTLNIKPCSACDFCRTSGTNTCVINDDMKDLYNKISMAKAIVLATPVYWFSYSAQLKIFIDRFYGLVLENNNVLENKNIAIALSFAGEDVFDSGAINVIRSFQDCFAYTKSTIKGFVYGKAVQEGDFENNEELCNIAKQLGKKLL